MLPSADSSLPAVRSPLPVPEVPSVHRSPGRDRSERLDRAVRARLERRAGSLLRSIRGGELYRRFGFPRLGDYVVQRHGLSLRDAQEMMRVDEALEALPVAAAAFATGGITAGHVRHLTRVATRENEGFLVALACRTTVKEFALAVASRGRSPGVSGAKRDPGEEEDRVRHEIAVPAWVAGWWRETAVLIRRLAGSAMPAGEAFGLFVAEMASIAPVDEDASDRRDRAVDEGGLPEPAFRSGGRPDEDSPATVCAYAVAAEPRDELPRSAPGADPSGRATRDARAIDGDLRAALTERQRADASLADHLRRLGRTRGYLGEGFRSLEAYASETFGLPPRSLHRLLALARASEALPALREAFVEGRITARQAVLLGRVASPRSLDAWMRRGERATLRRLEDEVEYWLHLQRTRPAVWEKLCGMPLPAGLSIAPGREPRLPPSARKSQASSGTEPISAAAFVRALEEEEAAIPLPERPCVITLWIEPGVRARWLAVVKGMKAHYGERLTEWQALLPGRGPRHSPMILTSTRLSRRPSNSP